MKPEYARKEPLIVGSRKARAQFASLLDRAEGGGVVIITRHLPGRHTGEEEVAALVSVEDLERVRKWEGIVEVIHAATEGKRRLLSVRGEPVVAVVPIGDLELLLALEKGVKD